MMSLEWAIRSLQNQTIEVVNFFFLVCLMVNPENVKEVIDAVPVDSKLLFRRHVVYTKNSGRFFIMGHGTFDIDDKFRDGLSVLRNHFAEESTLQFEDYLFLEKNRLLDISKRCADGNGVKIVKVREETRLQLRLIEQLGRFHEQSELDKPGEEKGQERKALTGCKSLN